MPTRRMFSGDVLIRIAFQAFKREHLVFEFDNALLEQFQLFGDSIWIHRRVNGRELRFNDNPCALINNLTLLSRAVAQRGNGA